MELNFNDFSGKTVLITGCNRGIGKAAVDLFAHRGANLICCLRKESEEFTIFIHQLSTECQVTIDILYFDLNDENSIKEALRSLIVSKRQIDVLVNNAGVAVGGLLSMTSMRELKEVFQVNFFSLVLITQMISKLMMRNKSGVIINVGSIAGLENFAGYTSYGCSKAAVMLFTKTIARELSPYGIRVNAIAPGLTDTRMATQMEEKAWNEMVDRTDLKRLADPKEIAELILFLSSSKASFITGQIYRIDGGM